MTVEMDVAGPGDAAAVLELMEQFYAGEGYPFDRAKAKAALEPFLADPRLGRAWILRERGTAIGYFVLTLGWSLEYGGRDAFVDELFVAPTHRGRGLGRLALETIDEACRELAVSALHLEVEKDNLPASELYGKRGFEDHDRRLMSKRFRAG
jgi:GNAT superfamily N-acetyltransferase